jgi:hypothetical protein
VVVTLVGDVGLGVRAWDTWGGTEVLKSLSVLGSSKEEGVSSYYNIKLELKWEKAIFTGGCKEHELVKSEALSSSFNDSGSCSFGESQGSDGELGDLNQSNVISHSANNDGDSISTRKIGVNTDFQRRYD